MKSKLIIWLILFMGTLLLFQLFGIGKTETASRLDEKPLGIQTTETEYSVGQDVIVEVQNNTDSNVTFAATCPKNPFAVYILGDGEPREITADAELNCDDFVDIVLAPGKKETFNYAYWKHALFSETGRYRVDVAASVGNETVTIRSNEFSVEPRSFISRIWNTALYQPIYNGLMLAVNYSPGKSLGLGIIILTLIIRLILLVPSQHAMASQKRMQELQPKLQAVQKKYAGNQERISQETMKLWKENKVNPFGSCLPLLIQFPFLIAIFYVIRDGLNPDSLYLLYEPLQDIALNEINVHFLGLDLKHVNRIVLPLIVGFLQFGQMKLAMAKKPQTAANADGGKGSEMAMAQNIMVYAMPVMIAVFTASMPAGVGLYWGVSTLFGLGQQVVVNRSK